VAGFFGIKSLFSTPSLSRFRKIASRSFWLIDVVFLIFSIGFIFLIRAGNDPEYVQYRRFFVISGGFTMILIVKMGFSLFVMLHYLKNLLAWMLDKAIKSQSKFDPFLSKARQNIFLLKMGAAFAIFLFMSVVYGMVFGKHNFKVTHVDVYFENIPPAFDGVRIAHFSDTHLGGYRSTKPVQKGIDVISSLQPDIVVFSGDLVNNVAEEAEKFIPVFQKLQPPFGMYSVLGNHDMGDYRRWGTIPEKESNLERLIEIKQEMGFNVLLNQHTFVRLGNDSIMIAGVENWGEPPFKKYGDLQKALGQNADFPFKLLISHDPSHWRNEIIPDTDIQLTFSGHTHGFQFGIITPFFKWSPVQWKYPEWNGLYQEGNQYIYVNRGFGFVGIPARIGTSPEITLITLKRK
jgi:predicted MPP superfamily phosphohydrolase